MKTVELTRKGKLVTIRYTVNDKKYMYSTKAQSFITHNCKKLNIRLDRLDNDWDDVELYYPFEDFLVLVIREERQYTQHIILRSAAKTNVKALIKPLSEKIKDCVDFKIKKWAAEKLQSKLKFSN